MRRDGLDYMRRWMCRVEVGSRSYGWGAGAACEIDMVGSDVAMPLVDLRREVEQLGVELARDHAAVLGEVRVAAVLVVTVAEGEAILEPVDQKEDRHHGGDDESWKPAVEERDVDGEPVRAESVGREDREAHLVERLALRVEKEQVGLVRTIGVHANVHILQKKG